MYIDPNTGGMLFQILAVFFALFSGIILFFSSKIKMFVARIGRNLRKNPEDPEDIKPDSDDDPILK